MDELVAQFTAITDAPARKAEAYIRISDGDIQDAIQLYFETGGADLDVDPSVAIPSEPAPQRSSSGESNNPIMVEDDDEDDDIREAIRASAGDAPRSGSSGPAATDYEDDEAMARRLQEELYGEGPPSGSNGVRAPIARTRETLVGPGEEYGDWPSVPSGGGRRGIFSQRSRGVWDAEVSASPEYRRRFLSEATNGASESSSKSNMLAEIFRPPYEIIYRLDFEHARIEARELERWILINVQDESIFDSQVLNRDIWKDEEVKSTVKEHFLFLQFDRTGRDGRDYIRLYMPTAADPNALIGRDSNLFPHIAIIDPRTGEQVKVWGETPKSPMEFVMQLHEFLERYSLRADAKNPVQRKTKQKDVTSMTEDEMLQLALQNSMGNGGDPSSSRNHDPDELTKSDNEEDLMEVDQSAGKGKQVAVEQTPFQKIKGDNHHQEPPNNSETTRIQFKLHDGSKVVRRFLLNDKVERLFEYVKADLLPEQAAKNGQERTQDQEFELICMGKKLIEILDVTIVEAGLRMGTVMVEIMED
ncbi:UBX domain protein Ubx2 [Rhizina undulata]